MPSAYAIGDTCTHRGGPLSEGDVQGARVTCPWHGADFDLKTGAALGPPARKGVPSYKVVVEGDDIKVEVQNQRSRRNFKLIVLCFPFRQT
jgi:nitrite reductase/ring-hydroxylating ferredoxin subunit